MDLTEAKEAAARLVKFEEAKADYDVLDEVLTKAGNLPVKLYDTSAVWLNPLLYLYKARPQTYQTIVQWVNEKRVGKGFTPLFKDKREFDKTDYMREFMAERRSRERRLIAIENARRADRDKLQAQSRDNYLRKVSAEWREEKDRMLDAAMAQKDGKRLTKEERQEILRLFWETIDRRLDDMENQSRRGLHSSLEAALRHDPYA